jgi:hypothetical protein
MNIRRSQERDKKAIPPGGLKAKDPNTRRPTRIFHFPNGHGDKHAENYDKEGSSWFSPGHPAEIHVFLLSLSIPACVVFTMLLGIYVLSSFSKFAHPAEKRGT